MFKKTLAVIVPTVIAGLAVAVMPAAHAEDKQPAKKSPVAAAKPAAVVQNGMVVVKDAVTGALRAPTAEEAAALAPPARDSVTAGATGPIAIRGPGGSVGLVLDDSTTVYAVAHKNADGTVSFGEATGADAAKQVVEHPGNKNKPARTQGAELK